MTKYIVKRLLESIVVLFVMSILAFAMINVAPGEPAAALYGGQMDKLTVEERDRINTNLGLDQPVAKRYLSWLFSMLHGEMGNSYAEGRSVNEIISERMPNTMLLFINAFILTVSAAMIIGLWAGLHPRSKLDKGVAMGAIILNGIPNFLVAIALISLFSVKLHWLPSAGSVSLFAQTGVVDRISHLILPISAIVLSHVGSFSRFIQERVKEEMSSYYVMVAKANHICQRDINRGVLKNALVPFINYAGSHIPAFFSGFVIIETVFAYAGMGNLIVGAIPTKDYPVLMGSIFVTGIVVVISMLCVDLVAMLLNPKLRKEAQL